jgi:hypothetical protein
MSSAQRAEANALDLRDLVQRDEPTDYDNNPEFRAPKRVRLPVPEHLKFFGYPQDLTKFTTDLYPNMLVFATANLGGDTELAETAIADFVAYMYDRTQDGRLRWQLYDVASFKRQPYFKWWLTNLRFYCLSTYDAFLREQRRAHKSVSIVPTWDDTVDQSGTISADRLAGLAEQIDPEVLIFVDQICTFLGSLEKAHTGKTRFEAHALRLFQLRLSGVSNKEIAAEFKISVSAVQIWRRSLENLIRPLFDEPDTIYALDLIRG